MRTRGSAVIRKRSSAYLPTSARSAYNAVAVFEKIMAVGRKALSLYDLARSAATFVLNLQARSLFFSILAREYVRSLPYESLRHRDFIYPPPQEEFCPFHCFLFGSQNDLEFYSVMRVSIPSLLHNLFRDIWADRVRL
jgi:hypothetical protein